MWGSVDPHGDSYPELTPYNYVAGNPIGAIDPTGEDLIKISYGRFSAIVDTKIAWYTYQLFVDLTDGGSRTSISSSFRTMQYQQEMRDRYDRGDRKGLVCRPAEPKRGPHCAGFALDMTVDQLTPDEFTTLKDIMRRHGFIWLGKKDRVHFSIEPVRHGYHSREEAIRRNDNYYWQHTNDPFINWLNGGGGGTPIEDATLPPLRSRQTITPLPFEVVPEPSPVPPLPA